jgi:hypothetical protein
VTPSQPRSQLVLRALVLLGPVVAVLATGPAGRWPPWWMLVTVVVLAGASAAMPDSPFGAGVGLVVLAWWTLTLGDQLPGWVVLAAVALVVAHVAGVLTSYGPATMPVDAATVRLWARRGALVLLTAPVAQATARLLRGEPEQPGIWMLGVGAALVATVVATAALSVPRDGG